MCGTRVLRGHKVRVGSHPLERPLDASEPIRTTAGHRQPHLENGQVKWGKWANVKLVRSKQAHINTGGSGGAAAFALDGRWRKCMENM